MKILIIEDDPTDLKLFSVLLDASGHVVRAIVDAESAAAEITRHRPDLIVLDLKLPKKSGLELVRELKHDPRTRGIPVIAVTGVVEDFTRERALAAGCDAYLVKPVDTRGLDALVRQPRLAHRQE